MQLLHFSSYPSKCFQTEDSYKSIEKMICGIVVFRFIFTNLNSVQPDRDSRFLDVNTHFVKTRLSNFSKLFSLASSLLPHCVSASFELISFSLKPELKINRNLKIFTAQGPSGALFIFNNEYCRLGYFPNHCLN